MVQNVKGQSKVESINCSEKGKVQHDHIQANIIGMSSRKSQQGEPISKWSSTVFPSE
jgi:hypothetical protein